MKMLSKKILIFLYLKGMLGIGEIGRSGMVDVTMGNWDSYVNGSSVKGPSNVESNNTLDGNMEVEEFSEDITDSMEFDCFELNENPFLPTLGDEDADSPFRELKDHLLETGSNVVSSTSDTTTCNNPYDNSETWYPWYHDDVMECGSTTLYGDILYEDQNEESIQQDLPANKEKVLSTSYGLEEENRVCSSDTQLVTSSESDPLQSIKDEVTELFSGSKITISGDLMDLMNKKNEQFYELGFKEMLEIFNFVRKKEKECIKSDIQEKAINITYTYIVSLIKETLEYSMLLYFGEMINFNKFFEEHYKLGLVDHPLTNAFIFGYLLSRMIKHDDNGKDSLRYKGREFNGVTQPSYRARGTDAFKNDYLVFHICIREFLNSFRGGGKIFYNFFVYCYEREVGIEKYKIGDGKYLDSNFMLREGWDIIHRKSLTFIIFTLDKDILKDICEKHANVEFPYITEKNVYVEEDPLKAVKIKKMIDSYLLLCEKFIKTPSDDKIHGGETRISLDAIEKLLPEMEQKVKSSMNDKELEGILFDLISILSKLSSVNIGYEYMGNKCYLYLKNLKGLLSRYKKPTLH